MNVYAHALSLGINEAFLYYIDLDVPPSHGCSSTHTYRHNHAASLSFVCTPCYNVNRRFNIPSPTISRPCIVWREEHNEIERPYRNAISYLPGTYFSCGSRLLFTLRLAYCHAVSLQRCSLSHTACCGYFNCSNAYTLANGGIVPTF